jgi:alkylated DNA repair dioxygenase AlkB
VATRSGPLFHELTFPRGFSYREAFVTPAEEAALLDAISTVSFSAFELRGVVARRRVAFFGESYDRTAAPTIPAFLLPFRERIADWARVDTHAFAMALINEYPPGAPIGWHRDAPQYDMVAGISLLSDCRMRFRPYRAAASAQQPGRRTATHEAVLGRRSAYLMRDESRTSFEYQIPPVTQFRYSVTFRTLRRPRSSGSPRIDPGL